LADSVLSVLHPGPEIRGGVDHIAIGLRLLPLCCALWYASLLKLQAL
jgi:hypothetical protein